MAGAGASGAGRGVGVSPCPSSSCRSIRAARRGRERVGARGGRGGARAGIALYPPASACRARRDCGAVVNSGPFLAGAAELAQERDLFIEQWEELQKLFEEGEIEPEDWSGIAPTDVDLGKLFPLGHEQGGHICFVLDASRTSSAGEHPVLWFESGDSRARGSVEVAGPFHRLDRLRRPMSSATQAAGGDGTTLPSRRLTHGVDAAALGRLGATVGMGRLARRARPCVDDLGTAMVVTAAGVHLTSRVPRFRSSRGPPRPGFGRGPSRDRGPGRRGPRGLRAGRPRGWRPGRCSCVTVSGPSSKAGRAATRARSRSATMRPPVIDVCGKHHQELLASPTSDRVDLRNGTRQGSRRRP